MHTGSGWAPLKAEKVTLSTRPFWGQSQPPGLVTLCLPPNTAKGRCWLHLGRGAERSASLPENQNSTELSAEEAAVAPL